MRREHRRLDVLVNDISQASSTLVKVTASRLAYAMGGELRLHGVVAILLRVARRSVEDVDALFARASPPRSRK